MGDLRRAAILSAVAGLLAACSEKPPEAPHPGVEPPPQPVLRYQDFEGESAGAPDPLQLPPGPRADFRLVGDGLGAIGEWTIEARVVGLSNGEGAADPRVDLVRDDGGKLTLAYRLPGGEDRAALAADDRVRIRYQSETVRGALRRQLVVRRQGRPVLAFVKDGGAEPVAVELGPQLQVRQQTEEMESVGGGGGNPRLPGSGSGARRPDLAGPAFRRMARGPLPLRRAACGDPRQQPSGGVR